MGQLEQAQERLEKALARLEDASQRVGGNSTAAQVEGELTALRQKCATLENNTQAVSERLDTAIERLQAILGESNGAG
ncbi:MAG: hypothetical protein CMM52_07705 [Rhodospirillaceae bacterium]|nr:hypothetical protein [Rhodospirillaceae bacterium]|tara:strand:- start:23704 stop:23937 length:234 start_codon:yes stop_codon:yes gene_type:complete